MFSRIQQWVNGSSQKKIEPVLQKTGGEICAALKAMKVLSQLPSTLDRGGEAILKEGKELGKVHWEQFALMHDASIIRETPFEGGVIESSLTAWTHIFTCWKEGKGLFLPISLTKEQIERVLETLGEMAHFQSLHPLAQQTPLSGEMVKEYARSFLKEIAEGLNKNKPVYVPLGYRHGAGTSGHVIVAKIALVEGRIGIFLMNQGDGSSLHPPLRFTTTQERVSYQFYPIFVKRDDFFGELGEAAFGQLVRYLADPPYSDQPGYCGRDLYNVFLTLGTVDPTFTQEWDALEANSQSAANCSEKAVKNPIRSLLSDEGVEKKEIQKAFLAAHLLTIVQGFHAYMKKPEEVHRVLFRNGVEKFGMNFKKLEQQYSHQEKVGVVSLLHHIEKKTEAPVIQKKEHSSLPKPKKIVLTDSPTSFPSLQLCEPEKIHHPSPIPQTPLPSVEIVEPKFVFETLVDDMTQWIEVIKTLPEEQKFAYFYDCTEVLPIPKVDEKGDWNRVSIEEGAKVISLLHKLLSHGVRNRRVQLEFTREFLAIHTVYTIIDALARQNPATKLDQFIPYFLVNRASLENPHFLHLPERKINERCFQVSAYLSGLFDMEKKRVLPIFPTEEVLEVEQYLDEEKHGANGEGYANLHLVYVKQFLPLKMAHASQEELLSATLDLWENRGGKSLPVEIHSLYYVTFLSSLTFVGNSWGGSQYPATLTFERLTDLEGRQVLKLEGLSNRRKDKIWVEGFCEMGEEGDWDSHFPEFFFSKEFSRFSINDAVCARIPEEEQQEFRLSEPLFRDLLRITRMDNLMPFQAAEWMGTHTIHLENPNVRQVLEHCFFVPKTLAQVVENEPSFPSHIRKVVAKCLLFYRSNPHHYQSILFLLRVGVCLETFFPEDEKRVAALEFYRDELGFLKEKMEEREMEAYQEGEIFFHELYFSLQKKTYTEEEVENLLLQGFQIAEKREKGKKRLDQKLSWIANHVMQPFRSFLYQSKALFESQEFLKRVSSRILTSHLLDFSQDQEITGVFPHYLCGDVVLDFLHCNVHLSGRGDLLQIESDFEDFGEAASLIKEHGGSLWEKDGVYQSTDGKLIVSWDLTIDCEITFQGKTRWVSFCRFNAEKADPLGCDFLNHWGTLPWIFFRFQEQEEGDPTLLCFEKDAKQPFLRVDYLEGRQTFTRIDKEGNVLPIQLVYLQELEKENKDLYQIGRLLAPPGEVVCFLNTQTGLVEELNFFKLKLHFVNEKGRLLLCKQHPGYFLLPGHTLEELNHYEGVLVLRNESGEGKVFIPSHRLGAPSDPFSSKATPVISRDSQFHSYEIDPIDASLVSSSPQANFYLAYLLKTQRKYEKAAQYATKAFSTFNFEDWKVRSLVERFKKIGDSSPSSVAFNLRFVLRLIEEKSLLEEEKLLGKNTHNYPERDLISWTTEVYTGYLRMLGEETLSKVPKGLRLSKGEEKTILFYLKRKKEDLPQLLQIRLDLLTRAGGQMTISIGEREVSLRPSFFADLKRPETLVLDLYSDSKKLPFGKERLKKEGSPETFTPHAIRMLHEDVQIHFHKLYEEARSSPVGEKTPFDFTLLTLFSSKQSYENTLLAHLLVYVRHFPFLFKDLPLKEEDSTAKQQEVFLQVLEKLLGLEDFSEFQEIYSHLTEAKRVFPYTTEIQLQHPKLGERVPLPGSLPSKAKEPAPFLKMGETLFKKRTTRSSYPSLQIGTRKGRLEKEQETHFQEGISSLKKKESHTFHLKSKKLVVVKKELQSKKKALRSELENRRKELHVVLNAPYRAGKEKFTREQLDEQIEFLFALESRQAEMLLPEKVMREGILAGDLNFWKSHRPQMSEIEVQKVMEMVKEYYHFLVLYEMAQEGCNLIESLQEKPNDQENIQALATRLHYEFLYDPALYPEISYMKIKTGKLPRPEQVEIYLWICEGMEKGEHRLFQLHAGGGKTSYLTPLVMLRSKMMGFLPAYLSTREIYSVEKTNLGTTLAKLGMKLAYLEVGMHMKLSAEDLHHIFDQIRIYREEGYGLILTPQIVYALQHLYRFATLKEKDPEKVKWLSLILAFLDKRVFLIGDESHRNLNPLTRAIFGVGEREFLPAQEQELFLSLMRPLLGQVHLVCEDQREAADVVKLKENTQGIPPKKDLLLVRKTLAEHMLESPLLGIPQDEKKEYFAYWTEKKGEMPESLQEYQKTDRKKADLIALTRYFLQDLLPQLVKTRTEFDHAPSIYPEEEFDTPCHHKTPSTAQFEDPYRTLALSIKGTFHRGLSEMQVGKLLTKLLEIEKRELEQIPELEETPTGEKFRLWVEDSSFKSQGLRDLNLSHPVQKRDLTKILRKHPGAIEEYLLMVILPQIAISDAQLYVTPVHLLGAFSHSISFSATPYLSAVYPSAIGSFKYDPTFEAHVVSEFCTSKNQSYLFPQHSEPVYFFDWLEKEGQARFEGTTILNDPGGFFCDYPNEEVARIWLGKNTKLDGIVYFKEARTLSVDSKQKISLLLREEKGPIEMEGSDLKKTLEEKGLSWEKMRLGSYYDAAHTESADILQKPDARMLLFGGDSLTYSHLIQSLMRARGFLDPKQDQTVCWVFQQDVATGIHPKKKLSGQAIFAWSQKNEVREMKKRVILAAYQEISFQIEKIAMDEIGAALREPEKQIELMEKYAGGFVEKLPHDPFGRYGAPTTYDETSKVLTAYAQSFYARFGYEIPYEKSEALLRKVEDIVLKVSEILEKIPTQITTKVASQIEQQQESKIKRETEKEEYRPRPLDPLSSEGVYGDFGIDLPSYPKKSKLRRTAREVFKCDSLTENLYFEENQLRTAREGGIPLGEKLLKPIDFFLIIHHEGETWAEVLINEVLGTFLNTLRKGVENEEIKHNAFIVTSEGALCQVGRGSLAPPGGLVEKVRGSQWFQDLIIDAALLRGQVRHPDRLLERLKSWDKFPSFWARIVEAQPNPETVNQFAISRLLSNT
ncbi:MAG: hypothetical protein K940chlam9_00653 [Chlamydiae bacterium]|nr:hypothetical protein [Chlamydiota bacterium]